MVLETEHVTATGRVRVIDCLALGHARPLLVRIVEGLEGRVDMTVELVVRFDYGSTLPWVRRIDDRWRAVAGPDGLELFTPVLLRGEDRTSAAEFTVDAGEQVPFVLGWFPSTRPSPRSRRRGRARRSHHRALGYVGRRRCSVLRVSGANPCCARCSPWRR